MLLTWRLHQLKLVLNGRGRTTFDVLKSEDLLVYHICALFRTFVKERKAFGGHLADKQTIQHRLATIKTEVCIGRTFADRCIELHTEKRLDNATASMAKYWLTDLQGKVADECVQLHGGAGYMWEYNIARAYADGRVARIYGGSNEIMKELIARDIVKK